MAEYNISDITKMQYDAAARVAEMQRRSNELIAQNASRREELPPEKHERQKPVAQKHSEHSDHHREYYEHKSGESTAFDLKSILPFDLSSFMGDRALILLVLFLLRGEKTDRLLMLALIYLAM